MKTNNTYFELATSVLRKAKKYLLEDWTLISKNENGTILEKKHFPSISSFECYRLNTIINKSKEELVNKIWDVDENIVKKNDPEISSWVQLESGENWKICQQFNNMPMPLYMRELLFTQAKIEEENTTWLVATSIPDHSAKSDHPYWCVRAHIYMSVWGFTTISPTQTNVCRIIHVEPSGLIPPFVVDATVSKHIKIIEKLGE